MLFNSIAFFIFLPIVFAVYWWMNRWTKLKVGLRAQNFLVLIVSYIFYGWWDWRFLGLIAFSTVVDYFVGLQIARANAADRPDDTSHRSQIAKYWLWMSLAINLGLLGYFKYANWFIESWVEAWDALGIPMHTSSLQIILPVGISFYTFQTLSYSIDVYRRQLHPTRDFIEFAAFVSFFPQLVAGPIERASALLPQIRRRRTFDYEKSVQGVQLIVWGLFKKVVVADTCALYANEIFSNYPEYSWNTLVLGAVYFAFQIYGDFSGYSDIAIGTAQLLGFQLMTNFRNPYFSRDIAEFWRRWHISLSTWFRDYLYIPLGGSRGGRLQALRNTAIIFLISGMWHGANWTFLAWGAIHALLFFPLLLLSRNRRHTDDLKGWPTLRESAGIASTFAAVCLAWIFFRAPTVTDAVGYLRGVILLQDGLTVLDVRSKTYFAFMLLAVILGITLEMLQFARKAKFIWRPQLWGIWLTVCLMYSQLNESDSFIYFQF